MPSPFPVWFIEARFSDEASPDGTKSYGSAVPVYVRKQGSDRLLKLLLTAQHVVRKDVEEAASSYAPDIRVWLPGDGYAERNFRKASVFLDLSPNASLPFYQKDDFAFLKLPDDVDAPNPCVLVENTNCVVGMDELVLCGFPGGEAHMTANGYRVEAAEYRRWRWEGEDSGSGIATLAPGEGAPQEGVSGGGVFREGRYAGIYRGMFIDNGRHIMLPVSRLRERCFERGYELVSAKGADLSAWKEEEECRDTRETGWNIFTVGEGGQVVLSSRHLENDCQERFEFYPEEGELAKNLKMIRGDACEGIDSISYVGTAMWAALTARGVAANWSQVRDAYAKGERIRLGFRLPDKLHSYPWEAVFSEARGDLALAGHDGYCIARLAPRGLAFAAQPDRTELSVLIIAPPCSNLPIKDEIGAIERAMAPLKIKPEILSHDATIEQIAERIETRKRWTVVHFIGHGRNRDTGDARNEIEVMDHGGQPRWVAAELFAKCFDRVDADLVVMNCCEGGSPEDRADLLGGWGPMLNLKGIPAVVAMQYVVTDRMAGYFTAAFYASLFGREDFGQIDVAVTAGRRVLHRNQNADYRAFITPVFYLAPGYERLPVAEPNWPPAPVLPVLPVTPSPLPPKLVAALKKGLCVPVVGSKILSVGAVRRENFSPPEPCSLTMQLAKWEERPYPCAEELNLCALPPEWISPIVFQRVCDHYLDGSEGLNQLIKKVGEACQQAKSSALLESLAKWEVPALFYTYIDGLLDRLQRENRSSFTRTITRLESFLPSSFQNIALERFLVLVAGSVLDEDSLILSGGDHERLMDNIGKMKPELINIARKPDTSVVFLGLSPSDPIARALARQLVDTGSRPRQGPTYFACKAPSGPDKAFWEYNYRVNWLEGELADLLPAMMEVKKEP